jgi:multidrug efflux pump subunit AcrA (membrane-fusion protein)
MNLKRTATIVVFGGALAAWLAAAATSGVRDAPAASIVQHPPIEARGAALATEIARLHERLRPVSSPRQSGRNLFQFTAPKPHIAPPALSAAHAAVSEASPAVVAPSFKLSGVAEDPGVDGPVRTAIIAGEGQLFLVKEGQMVTKRYRVSRISSDVVELVDVDTNVPLRLAMRP